MLLALFHSAERHRLQTNQLLSPEGEGQRYLQFCMEAFHATNVANGAGQADNAMFTNFTNLAVTNKILPGNSTAVPGTSFGE